MDKHLLLPFLLSLLSSVGLAQQTLIRNEWLWAMGGTNQYDSYLSPMEYTGLDVSLLYLRSRMSTRPSARWETQHFLHTAVQATDNPARTASDWGAGISYDLAINRLFPLHKSLTLKVGPMIGTDLGVLYNTRNGNNPAQARANLHLSASLGGDYHFKLRKLPLTLTYRAHVPMMGCMFTPQYGQSYYEISKGHLDHNVRFTHPFNAWSMRQMILLEIPCRRVSLVTGYFMNIRQSHVNHIKAHSYTHAFSIGFVRDFYTSKPAKRHAKSSNAHLP